MTGVVVLSAEKSDTGTKIGKDYTVPFVLDNGKLSRILDVMEQRFDDVGGSPFIAEFEFELASGQRVKTDSITKLQAFDNTVKNPIKRFQLTANTINTPHLHYYVNFNSRRFENISIRVESDSNKLASQAFAEVEEQVERTFVDGLMYKLRAGLFFELFFGAISLFIASLVFMLVFVGTPDDSLERPPYLSNQEIRSFAEQAKQARTTDEKIGLLFSIQLQQLERQAGSPSTNLLPVGRFLTIRNIFLAMPILIMLVCFVVLKVKYYPSAVFLWGDWEEHYKKMVSIRRTVWTVIIASMFVGIIGNLFVLSITPSLR